MNLKDVSAIHVGNTEIQKIMVGGGYCVGEIC